MFTYICPKCDWVGDEGAATDHYAREHATLMEAPFACKVCLFVTGYEARLDKHLDQRPHRKRVHELGSDPTNVIKEPSRTYHKLFTTEEKVEKKEAEKKRDEEKKRVEQTMETKKIEVEKM